MRKSRRPAPTRINSPPQVQQGSQPKKSVPKASLSKNSTNIYTPLTYDKVKKPWDRLSRFKPAKKVNFTNQYELLRDVWTKPLGPILERLNGLGPIYLWPSSVKGKPVQDWTVDEVEQFGSTGKQLAVLYHLRDIALERERQIDLLLAVAGNEDRRKDNDISSHVKVKLPAGTGDSLANAITKDKTQDLLTYMKNHTAEFQKKGFGEHQLLLSEMSQAAYYYDEPQALKKYVENISGISKKGWSMDTELSNNLGTVFVKEGHPPVLAWRGSESPTKNIRDWGKNVINGIGAENAVGNTRNYLNKMLEVVDFTGAMKGTKAYGKLQAVMEYADKQKIIEDKLVASVEEKYGSYEGTGHSRGGAAARYLLGLGSKCKKFTAFNGAPFRGMDKVNRGAGGNFESWSIEGDVVSAHNQQLDMEAGVHRTLKPRVGIKKGPLSSHGLGQFSGSDANGVIDVSKIEVHKPSSKAKLVSTFGLKTTFQIGKGVLFATAVDKFLNLDVLHLSADDIGEMNHAGLVTGITESVFRFSRKAVGAAPGAVLGGVAGFKVNDLTQDWNPVARAVTSSSAGVLAQRLAIASTGVAIEATGAAVGGEIGAFITGLAAETSVLGPAGWAAAAFEVAIGTGILLGLNAWEGNQRTVALEEARKEEARKEVERRLQIKNFVSEKEHIDLDVDSEKVSKLMEMYSDENYADLPDEEKQLRYVRIIYPDLTQIWEDTQNAKKIAGIQDDELYDAYVDLLHETTLERFQEWEADPDGHNVTHEVS